MKDAQDYNREMKVSLPRYKTVWKKDKRTGYTYQVVKTLGKGEK